MAPQGRPQPHAAAAAATRGGVGRLLPVSAELQSRARVELRPPGYPLTIFNSSPNSLSAQLPSVDPEAHFRFRGLPPHIRRKCVRPGEEGRRARDAGGSCAGPRLPRLQSPGTEGQGRSKGVAGRREGSGRDVPEGREDTDSGLLINIYRLYGILRCAVCFL